ncbi:hypothetical protein AC578_2876 [Pseudocercospora eumusae]|uniref:Uncharacterized protein n=1 Tax=Pseudocercospora eumusae TaxID=321146 RepID=A0A139H3K9_9PEZI|nr:hypothetical protein AC578_2876 [Pseudocercospora eumusae]
MAVEIMQTGASAGCIRVNQLSPLLGKEAAHKQLISLNFNIDVKAGAYDITNDDAAVMTDADHYRRASATLAVMLCRFPEKIPSELRNDIYQIAFTPDHDVSKPTVKVNLFEAKPPENSLLSTCR